MNFIFVLTGNQFPKLIKAVNYWEEHLHMGHLAIIVSPPLSPLTLLRKPGVTHKSLRKGQNELRPHSVIVHIIEDLLVR